MTKTPIRITEYLTPAEVAKRFLVSPITVRQWADKGWLNAIVTPGGHRRFALEEVERFARERARNTSGKTEISRETPRLLVVDDDIQFAGFLAELLESHFSALDIRVVHDGFNAGRQVQRFAPHLILLDLMMPGIDGFQVCSGLKNDPLTQEIDIIAMTGFFVPENVNRILACGAKACFNKPLDLPTFLAAVREGISRTAHG